MLEHYYLNKAETPCEHGYMISDEFCPKCCAECHGCGCAMPKASMAIRETDPVRSQVEWFFCTKECEANWNSGQEGGF